MWSKTNDASIIDDTGKVIYFSTDRFIQDVCDGNCCFICGTAPGSKLFNDEHVLPDWILRRYSLFNRTLGLPNGTLFKYAGYKIPCCKDCNSKMGVTFEGPMRSLIDSGHGALSEHLKSKGPLLPFTWLSLIFMKTHLRDRMMSWHLDRRLGHDAIASAYDWSELHHVHTVCRAFYTGAAISKEVFGTFFVLPAKCDASDEKFDFYDLYAAQALLIRLDDVAILAVFNDSTAPTGHLLNITEGVTGPLSSVQLRELLVEAACCNLQLKTRPIYRSAIDLANESIRLIATLSPKGPEFEARDISLRGKLMEAVFAAHLKRGNFEGYSREEFLRKVREGLATFIYDNDGKFITNGFKKN